MQPHVKRFATTQQLRAYLSSPDLVLPCLAFVQNDWDDTGKWNNHRVDISDIVWAKRPFITRRKDILSAQAEYQNRPFIYFEDVHDNNEPEKSEKHKTETIEPEIPETIEEESLDSPEEVPAVQSTE